MSIRLKKLDSLRMRSTVTISDRLPRSLSDAQLQIARQYGFPSWPKLKAHVDSLEEAGQLKDAIDRNDLSLVKSMMLRNPALHKAPLGYAKDGPLTWVAECRVPRVQPDRTRLAIANW